MKLSEAKKLARELRDHHGLDDWKIDWKEWAEYEGVVATTYVNQKRFEFSPLYFSLNNEKFCEDQILHEFAHALIDWYADNGEAHGDNWRKKCVEIGAIPHEIWEGYHSYKSPFGDKKAHRFEGD